MTAMASSNRNFKYIVLTALLITVVVLTRPVLQGSSSFTQNIHKSIEDTFRTSYEPKEFRDPSQANVTVTSTIVTTAITTSVETKTVTATKTTTPTSLAVQNGAVSNTTKYFSNSPDSFDVVVNWYKDNKEDLAKELEEIRGLPILSTYSEVRVFIYVKDEEADLEEFKEIFDTPFVFHHENKGRESSAFLEHIDRNWDNLGAHTFFRQAHMHHYNEAITRITDFLVPPTNKPESQTGMLSLGWFERCLCTHCHDPWDKSRIYSRLPEMYSMIHGELCPGEITLTYIGQFVVSRKRLHDNPRSLYQGLNTILMSDMDHWIHSDPREGLPDSSNAPAFGHTMERSWMVLFSCESVKMAETCGTTIQSLLQPRKDGDEITKCQCLDNPEDY